MEKGRGKERNLKGGERKPVGGILPSQKPQSAGERREGHKNRRKKSPPIMWCFEPGEEGMVMRKEGEE